MDESAAAGAAATESALSRRPAAASGNRLDASIVKLRERQLLMKREEEEEEGDVENGESPPPAVSPSPSGAPLNPEVILTEVNSESEAFNATLQPIKVCNQSPISILYRVISHCSVDPNQVPESPKGGKSRFRSKARIYHNFSTALFIHSFAMF